MKRLSVLSVVAIFSMGLAGTAFAGCEYPHSDAGDNIPHGATASASDMKSAQQKVGSYVKQLEAFVSCVDAAPSATRSALMQSRDSAVSQAKDLAKRINREIRNYNRSAQLRQAST